MLLKKINYLAPDELVSLLEFVNTRRILIARYTGLIVRKIGDSLLVFRPEHLRQVLDHMLGLIK